MYALDSGPEADALRIADLVPLAFFRLSAMAEHLHADLGVSAPERGLLKDLFLDGAQTVPDLARKRPRSRQAVQQIVDGLLARAFVALESNPRHKRSKAVALTRAGVALCVAMQEREVAAVRGLLERMGTEDLASTADALARLCTALGDELEATAASQSARA